MVWGLEECLPREDVSQATKQKILGKNIEVLYRSRTDDTVGLSSYLKRSEPPTFLMRMAFTCVSCPSVSGTRVVGWPGLHRLP